ncbi:MAG: hypothetical protein WCH34_05170 [Bacteroidota bacterium]
MFCKNCGKEINENATACIGCGFNPLTEKNFCQHCGNAVNQNQVICVKCGCSLATKKSSKGLTDNIGINNKYLHNGNINISAIVLAALMLISLFLPWISSEFGPSINALNSYFNQLVGPYGYLCLLLSIGSITALIFKFRYSMWLGIAYLFFVLIAVISVLNFFSTIGGSFPIDKFIEGGIGLILAIISSIIYIILTKKEIKQS